jgi:hypothetical protein
VLKKVWATTIALVSCMRLQQKYTLKLPPVYKETKVYIKCFLFRFLSSITKLYKYNVYTTHSQSQQPAVSSFPVCVVRLYPVHLSAFSVVVQRYLLPVVTVVTVVTEATVYPQESLSITRTRDSAACCIITHSPCRCWVSKDTLVFVVTTTPLFLY